MGRGDNDDGSGGGGELCISLTSSLNINQGKD